MAANRFIEVIREGIVGDVSPKRVARAMGHLRSAGRERIGTRGPAELAQGKITSFEGHAILGDGASVAVAPEKVGECGDCGDTTLAARVATDPKVATGLQGIVLREAWATAERGEGQAPAVRRRQTGKAFRGHVVPEDPLDKDLRESEQDLVEPTPYIHAERALDLTGRFARKHNGGVTRITDHATIGNPTRYKDEVERQQRERRLAAKAPVVDDIDLAEARINLDLVRADREAEINDNWDMSLDPEAAKELEEKGCFTCGESVPAARRVTKVVYDVHALIAAGEEGLLTDDSVGADGAELETVSLEALEEQHERPRILAEELMDYASARGDNNSYPQD